MRKAWEEEGAEINQEVGRLDDEIKKAEDRRYGLENGVEPAKFKKTWPSVGMKLVIKEALAQGKDRVAWLGGRGQAQR